MHNSMPQTDIFQIERMLPLLFIMPSRDVLEKYKNDIELNLERN